MLYKLAAKARPLKAEGLNQPAAIGGHAAAEGAWRHEAGREPALAELLGDPIMALLWRADRLAAAKVQAELRALQLSLRQLRRAGPPGVRPKVARPPATSGARVLAA
jgi:hypothetical protein